MKFIWSPRRVNYLISVEFIQLFNLLQINFTNQNLFLINIQNLTSFTFIYQCIFLKIFEPTITPLRLQQHKGIKKQTKNLNLSRKYNAITHLTQVSKKHNTLTNLPSYTLHKHFTSFKKSFTNPPFNLFNPLIRARRRRYGTLNEHTPFVSKLKMNRIRRKTKFRKTKSRFSWWRNLRSFWQKLLTKQTLPRHYALKSFFKKKTLKLKLTSQLSSTSLLNYMFKTSFNKQFKILSNSVTNFNKTNKNITQLILMSYFNRFRRFSQLYPVNKHTVTYFTRRFDSTNYLLTKKLTKKLQNNPYISTQATYLTPTQTLPNQVRSKQANPLINNSSPLIRTFLFRKQLSNCINNFITTSVDSDNVGNRLNYKFRSQHRRKMTKANRVRLPRVLHFTNPYRTNLTGFYSLSTHFYLLQKVRRRFKKTVSSANKAILPDQYKNRRTGNYCKTKAYLKPWGLLTSNLKSKGLNTTDTLTILKKQTSFKAKTYYYRKKILRLRLTTTFSSKLLRKINQFTKLKQNRTLRKHNHQLNYQITKLLNSSIVKPNLCLLLKLTSFELKSDIKLNFGGTPWSNFKLNWQSLQTTNRNIKLSFFYKTSSNIPLFTEPKLSLKPFRSLPFILSSTGFIYSPLFTNSTNSKSLSYIKRIKYSFFNVLNVKRFILKERSGRSFLRRKLFKKFQDISNVSPSSTTSVTNLIFNRLAENRNSNLMNTNLASLPPISEDIKIFQNPNFSSYDDYGLQVKRIRFKPGYSRLWREARSSLNQVLNLKFRYQHRLTTYLSRFAQLSSSVRNKLLDLKLKNLLIQSRFVFDSSTALELLSNKLVYVNGHVVTNPNLLLFIGDVVQMIIQFKFYVVYRWLLNWYFFKAQRKSRLARSKFKKISHAQTKQRSRKLPDWLLRMRGVDKDIFKFIEVDFFTLSSFVIYTPFFKSDVELLDLIDSRVEIFNMYNWKYIN